MRWLYPYRWYLLAALVLLGILLLFIYLPRWLCVFALAALFILLQWKVFPGGKC